VIYLPNTSKPKKRPLFASEATWKTKFACLLPMWYWCWHTSKSILQGTKHGKRLHCPVQVPLQIFYCSLQTASRLPRPKVRKHFPAQPSLSKRRPFHGAQGPSKDVHNWWQMTWDVAILMHCLPLKTFGFPWVLGLLGRPGPCEWCNASPQMANGPLVLDAATAA